MMYDILSSLACRLTAVTAVILTIKLLFGKKISARLHNYLWYIPLTQFVFCLLNIKIKSEMSVYNYVYSIPDKTQFSYNEILTNVWLAGVILSGFFCIALMISYLIKVKKLPDCRRDYTEEKNILKVKGMPEIKNAPKPFCFGRYIAVPESCDRMIVLHELSHYAGHDSLKIKIALFTLCVNWFNPVIWLAYKMFMSDLEILCDERIIGFTGKKKEYAELLAAEAIGERKIMSGSAFASINKYELITRLKRIAAYGKKNPVWVVFFLVVCTVTGVVFLTDKAIIEKIVPERIVSVQLPDTEEQTYPTAEPIEEIDTAPSDDYIVSSAEPTVTQKPVKKSKKYTPAPKKSQKTAVPAPTTEVIQAESTPISTVNEKGSVTDVEIGSSKSEVYEKAGAPENVSANGSREVYALEDGKTAVLQYNGDVLENAYIIENGE